jgi:hypothetical protein
VDDVSLPVYGLKGVVKRIVESLVRLRFIFVRVGRENALEKLG